MTEHTEETLHALVQLSSVVNSSLDINEVLNRSMRFVEEMMDAEASAIFELDQEREELFFRVARGESGGKSKEVRMKMGEGVVGWVLSWLEDYDLYTRFWSGSTETMRASMVVARRVKLASDATFPHRIYVKLAHAMVEQASQDPVLLTYLKVRVTGELYKTRQWH